MNKLERIRQLLTEKLQPSYLEVINESEDHRSHAGYDAEGSHFAVMISAKDFPNQSRVQIHRKIYSALDEMMINEIHALRIFVRGPLRT